MGEVALAPDGAVGGSQRAKATYDKGRAELARGDVRAALESLLLALKLNRGNPAYVLAAADAHAKLGQRAAAATLYARAQTLRLSPKQAAVAEVGLAAASAACSTISAARLPASARVVPPQPTGRDASYKLSRNRDLALHTAAHLPLRTDARPRPGSAPASAEATERRRALTELAQVTKQAGVRAAAAQAPVDPAAASTKAVAGAAAEARRHAMCDLERATRRAREEAYRTMEAVGGVGMRFATEVPANQGERAEALRALAEDAQHARRAALTRDESQVRNA